MHVQVLNQIEPAPASCDSWMGNQLIDPSFGKRACEKPEARIGRPSLFPLMQQVRMHGMHECMMAAKRARALLCTLMQPGQRACACSQHRSGERCLVTVVGRVPDCLQRVHACAERAAGEGRGRPLRTEPRVC
jgi:hypothetical protein